MPIIDLNRLRFEKRKTKIYSVRLALSDYLELTRRARVQGRRPAAVIRGLVSAWLEAQR